MSDATRARHGDQNAGGNEMERLRRQAAALAAFGKSSLRTHDLDALLHEACEQVQEAAAVELVKVLELLPDGDTMLVRQGVNWQPGVVGEVTFEAHEGSPSGYALQHGQPVTSMDTAHEERFQIPQFMLDHGIKSMVNVVIRGEQERWGVLEVDSRESRRFNDDDIAFLQNYANLIAAAIDRQGREKELQEALAREKMLLAELQHRVRNMIMNIRALARRTRRSSRDLDEYAAAFDARLLALARTQELLGGGVDARVDLDTAIRRELAAHGAEEGPLIRLSGPTVTLPAKAAQALAMAFQELATNASKHGALRNEGARLDVTWRMESSSEGEAISIFWRETGVAIDGQPTRRGFGSETIEKSLPHMLGGDAVLIFHDDGLECRIRFPVPTE